MRPRSFASPARTARTTRTKRKRRRNEADLPVTGGGQAGLTPLNLRYTNVTPCITCTKQGGAEQKMMPIKDEQGAAFFERPFRAQETNAPHGCGLERHFSSMLRLQGRLERPPSSVLRLQGRLERHPSSILRFRGGSRGARRAFCGSRAGSSGTRRVFCGSGAGSSGHFEPSAAPGRARAAISSHLRLLGGLEQPFRANMQQIAAFRQAGHESPRKDLEREARSKLYE